MVRHYGKRETRPKQPRRREKVGEIGGRRVLCAEHLEKHGDAESVASVAYGRGDKQELEEQDRKRNYLRESRKRPVAVM